MLGDKLEKTIRDVKDRESKTLKSERNVVS